MMEERVNELEKKVQRLELTNVRQEVNQENIIKALAKIESNQTWLVRLILGTIVTGILVFIIGGGVSL